MKHLLSRPHKGAFTSFSTRRETRGLRVTPWQDSADTMLLTPTASFTPLHANAVKHCVEALHRRGVQQCITPAISPPETKPFTDAGFVLKERLHLLSLPLQTAIQPPPPEVEVSIRPGRRWHDRAVLRLDNLAFDNFWKFNRLALHEAMRATPSSYYRVAIKDQRVLGYAVTGKATNRGYLQRLAVDPGIQSKGIGTSLIFDALYWLQRRGVKQAFVNTQECNTRAFRLYQHLGFTAEKNGLVVLQWVPSG